MSAREKKNHNLPNQLMIGNVELKIKIYFCFGKMSIR